MTELKITTIYYFYVINDLKITITIIFQWCRLVNKFHHGNIIGMCLNFFFIIVESMLVMSFTNL